MDKVKLLLITSLILISACSQLDSNFKGIGSSILSSTGYVSGSQADAAFEAGEKLGKAATALNDEQEYYLGRSVSAMVFAKYKPLRNQKAINYINKVGMTVASVSDKPETFNGYHFMILDSNEINALSAPGGYVFLTKGFIRLLPDEDALAAVLAHEVAHIVKGHGMNAISSSNLTDALLIIGKEAAASQTSGYSAELTGLFGDSVNEVFDTVINKGYSKSQEYDADEYAATLLVRAGYNPKSLEVALQQLAKSGESDEAGGWSSTHPKATKRISNVEDTVEDLSETVVINPASQATRTSRFKSSLAGIG